MPCSEQQLPHIQLPEHSLARCVEVALDDAEVIFSDNYGDLPAQTAVSITCPLLESWS